MDDMNEILGVFEKYQEGKTTRAKAMEDVKNLIDEYADSRPIVGYVRSGVIKKLFQAIIDNKKDSDKIYEVNITLHKNEFDDIERLIKAWRQ